MDKKFLHKVLDQIVSETSIDYDMGEIQPPFSSIPYYFSFVLFFPTFTSLSVQFFKHCRDVYGLNDDEVEYVLKEYEQIVKDKIENNGL